MDRGRWAFGSLSGRARRIVVMAGVRMIYANKSEDDILLGKELKNLEKENLGHINICFTLSHPPKDWNGNSGHIDEQMILEHAVFENHDSLNYFVDTIS
ncbi:hypothetical protein BGZ65_012666, partial [Modicella reniformis]